MYLPTQEAVAAEIAYRQHRLAADFRSPRAVGSRRWHRTRSGARTRM